MKKACIILAIVLVIIAPAAAAGWPPEPMIEMRVPVAPTAFSTGRNYLVYEIRLTNEAKTPLAVRRLEMRDADKPTTEPIAAFEGESLDKVLQHFGNPAIGDLMPEAVGGHRNLAAGETAIVFLTVIFE